jgi:hypothetical protein
MSDNDEIRRKINAIIAKKMEFVDFGYMEFIYSKLPYIPFFHYLVAKDETCFIALNLETQLFTVDDTQRKAVDFLYDLIMSHIKDVTERGDFTQLIEDAKSNEMDEYWCKYREMEFTAAQKAFNNRKKDAISKVEIVEG